MDASKLIQVLVIPDEPFLRFFLPTFGFSLVVALRRRFLNLKTVLLFVVLCQQLNSFLLGVLLATLLLADVGL